MSLVRYPEGIKDKGRQYYTYVHMHTPRKKRLARWVQQQHTLQQVKRVDDQQVILAVAAAHDQPVEGSQQTLRNVPLKPFLQLEELAESRVGRQVREHLTSRRLLLLLLLWLLLLVLGVGMFAGTAGTRKTDLCEEAFDLLKAFFDFTRVEGGEVVEGEGEEGLHDGRWVGVGAPLRATLPMQ